MTDTVEGLADRGGPAVTDPVEAEIARLREEIKTRQTRINEIRRLRSYPTVIPVIIEWRHHHRYEEAASSAEYAADPLYEAFANCCWAIDSGNAAPEGVSVGGVMHTMAELEVRFGKTWDEVVNL